VTAPAAADRGARSLRYLPGVDGLRAVSVLAVLVYHNYAVGGHEAGWLPGGFLGVEVFFVVSGYLITSLLLSERRETGTVSLKQFWFRRGRRLLPALYLLLAVVVAYSLMFLPDAIEKLRSDVVAALTYTSNWWQILADRSYFAEAGRPAVLKHLWSLAIEEQFYLVWPLVLLFSLKKFGRQRTLLVTVGVALFSVLWCALLARGSFDRAYYGTDTRLSGLLLGSAFAFVFAPYRIRGVPGRSARLTLDVAALVGLVVLFLSFRNFTDQNLAVFNGGFLLVDIATLLVIAAAVHPASDTGRILGFSALVWIGVRSYSIYLWHYPIFAVTRPELDFRSFGHLSGWPVTVIRFALTFLAAELSFRFIETPIRKGAIGQYVRRTRSARGHARTRLATRGALGAMSLALLAVLLMAGLANAQPRTEKIFGVDASAHKDDNGEQADAEVLRRLLGSSTTASTTTTKAPTTTVAGVTATTAPPPTTPPAPPHALAIGDSVMLGAKGALEAKLPGIAVDAKVSRQFGHAIDVLRAYRDAGVLPGVVVIHLGTNGRLSNEAFDQMMQIAEGRQVYFLTARVPRLWEADVNNTLHAGAQRWPNAHVVEWRDYAGSHDDWFANDGFHVTRVGAAGYAQLVYDALT
jgi:peptidoglycan/LPS O-acetylase OafA/YrhL